MYQPNQFTEPRCGPLSGAGYSLPLSSCDVDAPQPLIDRRPSVSMLKWNNTSSKSRNDAPTPTAGRQGLTTIYSIFLTFIRFLIIYLQNLCINNKSAPITLTFMADHFSWLLSHRIFIYCFNFMLRFAAA